MAESIFVQLFEHNLWANDRLLEACARLDADQLDWSSKGTYGSIRDTLVHLAAAQARYVGALQRSAPDESVVEGQPYPGIAAVTESSRKSGSKLIEHARANPTDRLFETVRRGHPETLLISTLLIQAINHATEHRAHVNTILGQHGVEPPGVDGWAYAKSR
jgi:uncharacterized damage-inducible protein DinB